VSFGLKDGGNEPTPGAPLDFCEVYHVATASSIRDEARRIVEQLPEDASWEDLIYRIYVRQAIEAGLRDAEAGRTLPAAEVRRQFGLPE
jgi:hypothetical protein